MKILAEHFVLEILKDEMLPTDLPSDVQQIRKVFLMEDVQVHNQMIGTIYVMEKNDGYELISEDKFNQMNYALKTII